MLSTSGCWSNSIALGGHIFSHMPHFFLSRYRQCLSSNAYFKGTAWGNVRKAAVRFPNSPLNGSGTFTGHFSAHWPQVIHFSSLTYRGCFSIWARKLPGSPCRSSKRLLVIISIFAWPATWTSLGENMQVEQSLVGKVLSSRAMAPPRVWDFSKR